MLAGMIRTDETALICDLAETYHVLDWRALPLKTAAALASGLREDSRIKMRILGQNADMETTLLASILDRVTLLAWMQTKDGHKNRNRPESVLARIMKKPEEEKKDDFMVFESPDAFNAMWNKLTNTETEEGDEHGSGESVCPDNSQC